MTTLIALYIPTCNIYLMAAPKLPINQQPPVIRQWMDMIESSFEGSSQLVGFEDVALSTVPNGSILSQTQWFGGASVPTYKIPAGTVSEFVQQYRAYSKITASHLIPAVDDFFALKFPNALLSLFNAATILGQNYSGTDITSGEFTDLPIVPTLVSIPSSFTIGTHTATGDFVNPASTFKNKLTVATTTIHGGWLKNYFKIDNSQSTTFTESGDKVDFQGNIVQTLFGVFDPDGYVDGVYYTNSTNKSSKPERYVLGQYSALTNKSSTAAHVLKTVDPMSAFFVGKGQTGYMSIHINEDITTSGVTLNTVPLGIAFAGADFVTTLNNP